MVNKPSAILLHLLAVTSVAVAQPLFDILSRYPEMLVAHRAGPADVLLLTAALFLGPPLLLFAVERLAAAISRPAAVSVYLLCVAGGLSLLSLLALARFHRLPVVVAVLAAVLIGVGGALAVARWELLRSILSTAGILSLAFPLLFLFGSPVRRLVLVDEWRGAHAVAEPLQQHPVVLVVFDELPLASLLTAGGAIDGERFPAFASFAERATWYPRATAVASATQHAVPSLLTGRYPRGGQLPSWTDHPENLFTLLGGSYRIEAFETLTDLCPPQLCTGEGRPRRALRHRRMLADLSVVYGHLALPRRLAQRLPVVGATWRDFRLPAGRPAGEAALSPERSERLDVAGTVERFLEGLVPGDGPGLHYLHLELPHIPWRYLPSGVEYGPVSRSNFAHGVGEDTSWRDDPWLIAQGLQRHLLQLGYADRILGSILRRLEETGLYQDTVVVVTADHGLAFEAGEPGRRLTPGNVHEVLSIPLFVRLPGQTTGQRNELPAELVDLLPTVAAALEARLPWEVDGRSLLEPEPGPGWRTTKTFFDETAGRLAVVPRASFEEPQRRAVGRISTLLPPGTGLDGLFRIGPNPELLGRSLEELQGLALTGSEERVTLDQPWLLQDVVPGSGFLPAQIEGTLRPLRRPQGGGQRRQPRELAVAVNGVVRALSRSFFLGEAERFSALVPEGSFIPGANRVDVLLVERRTDGRLELAMAQSLMGPRYDLVRGPTGEVTGIVASNETSCALTPGAIDGELFRDGLTFEGWVLDVEGLVARPAVLVFAEDRLIYATGTGGVPPPAAARPAGAEEVRSGFHFGLTKPLMGRSGAEPRVFAVAAERCIELLP